jgi:hypothetical protein
MTWAGRVSCPQSGDVAAGAAVRCGATPLEALIVGRTAAHGSHCWETDKTQAELIVQRNGRNPHPRSVARARRNAAAKGFLHVKRVFPFQRPEGARFRAGAGTTNKSVNWNTLKVRNPMTRGERKRAAARMNVAVRPSEQPVGPRAFNGELRAAATPRPVAPPPRDYLREYSNMAAPAVAAAEKREQAWQQAADERMLASVQRPRPPPE